MPDSTLFRTLPLDAVDDSTVVVIPSLEAVMQTGGGIADLMELLGRNRAINMVIATSAERERLSLSQYWADLADENSAMVLIHWYSWQEDRLCTEIKTREVYAPSGLDESDVELVINIHAVGSNFWMYRPKAYNSQVMAWQLIMKNIMGHNYPGNPFEMPGNLRSLLQSFAKYNRSTSGYLLAQPQVERVGWRLIA